MTNPCGTPELPLGAFGEQSGWRLRGAMALSYKAKGRVGQGGSRKRREKCPRQVSGRGELKLRLGQHQ